jgi:hypothetical protein
VKVPETEVITEANAWIEPDFTVVEHPLRVLDKKERKTRRHTVKMYKIQWSHHTEEKLLGRLSTSTTPSIWVFFNHEIVRTLPLPLPLSLISESQDEIPFKGVGCNTSGVYIPLVSANDSFN